MSLRNSLLAATMLAIPAIAQAQPVTGIYVAAGAGVNFMGDSSDRLRTDAFPFFGPPGSVSDYGNLNVRTNIGPVGLASIGWGFGNGFRVEVEGSIRHNAVDRVRAGTQPTLVIPGQGQFPNSPPIGTFSDAGGTIRNYAAMLNVVYDFNLGWIMPYLGAGIGVSWVDWDDVGGTGTFLGAPPGIGFRYRASGISSQFAYQGIAGAAIPIRSIPGLAITAEYRYFASLSPSFSASVVSGEGFTGPQRGRVTMDNQHHSLLIGVRYNFGQVRTAPVAQQRPDPARSFLVFFDFNRAELTPRAREIIAQAAAASRTQQATRIEVSGHADRAGTPQYNQGLSQRRANTVASELVRLGVPRGAIAVAAFGESRPLVPTEDGVREPQNRRVEIIFR